MKLGIDVGQTFTDAVIVDQGGRFLGKTKQMTTDDCMVGIRSAAKRVFADTNVVPQDIKGIFIGGTYSYALQTGVDLARTALIRIMRSPSVIKPTMDMPQKFAAHVHKTYQIYGGRHFDGTRYGSPQSLRKQLAPILEEMAESEIEAVALISTFSPLFTEDERQVEQYIRESLPQLHVTMPHTLQSIGFIERENTALMNALLAKVLRKALHGLEVEFKKLDFQCPFWLTQNNGSIMSWQEAMSHPVQTCGSGATNCLRGAALLSDLPCCIVVDAGGSTIEIGRVKEGEPDPVSNPFPVSSMEDSIHLPYTVSLPIGDNSVLGWEEGHPVFTPRVVKNIREEALCWGGGTCTITDAFLRLYPDAFGEEKAVSAQLQKIPIEKCRQAVRQLTDKVWEHIERLQSTKERLPVILVGGAAPLLSRRFITKYDQYILPEGYAFSNAFGACHAPVSAHLDRVYSMQGEDKEDLLREARSAVRQIAESRGARSASIRISLQEEYRFPYLKRDVLRIRMQALGELDLNATPYEQPL